MNTISVNQACLQAGVGTRLKSDETNKISLHLNTQSNNQSLSITLHFQLYSTRRKINN